MQKLIEKQIFQQIEKNNLTHYLETVNVIYATGKYPPFKDSTKKTPFLNTHNLKEQLESAIPIAKQVSNHNLLHFCYKALSLYNQMYEQMQINQLSLERPSPQSIPLPTISTVSSESIIRADNVKEQIPPLESSKRVNPSVTARNFIDKVPVKIYREGYYIFIDGYYQLLSELKMKRILNHFYRKEAEKFRFAKFYEEVLQFVQCEQDLVVTNDRFDDTKYLISFRNGILDTITMKFYPPDPSYFITTCVAEDYLPSKSNSHHFDQFISIIANSDAHLINRIYEIIGLILSNDPDAKSIFCAQGVTNSGKSTLIKFIASLFPEEQVTAVAINGLDRSFALKEFIGKSLCTDTELSPDPLKTPWVAKLKQLSSSDPLSTDVKFKDYATFVYRGKIFLATNHRFLLSTPDNAFMKRIVALPFICEIPKQQMNTNILKTFESERPAIINKAIHHYCQLRNNNYIFSGNFEINQMFGECPTMQASSITKSDIVQRFIIDKLEITSNFDDFVFTQNISELCNNFCATYNFPIIEQKELTRTLKKELGTAINSGKRRPPGHSNPLNALLGLKIKN